MQKSNIKLFLDLIAYSEGTSTSKWTQNNGYDVLVGGSHDQAGDHVFTNYSRHPFESRAPKIVRSTPLLVSTAAGRYQIILPTWKQLRLVLHLDSFNEFAQDCCAVELLKEHGAIEQIQAGAIEPAIYLTSRIWASFPGNDYGQGGHSMETLLTKYNELQSFVSSTEII
jgi:muramidase (phage lysozyme)